MENNTDSAKSSLRILSATYRLQFHAGFGFRDASAILPYLRDLGEKDVYASPYLNPRSSWTGKPPVAVSETFLSATPMREKKQRAGSSPWP